MFKKLLAAVAVSLAFAGAANAQYIPPAGPLLIKFNNSEQIGALGGNSIVAPSGALEQNWGIFAITSIQAGDPTTLGAPGQLFDPLVGNIFSAGAAQGFITGIFWGIGYADPTGTGSPLASKGGYLDIWWQSTFTSTLNASTANRGTGCGGGVADLGGGNTDNCFAGFTSGSFLGRLQVMPGIVGTSTVDIVGSSNPTVTGFSGQADSYADVVDVNKDGKINNADGLWAGLLNGDWFNVNVDGIDQTRDTRFQNRYSQKVSWNDLSGCTSGGTCAVGATSEDPIRAFTVPEPDTLALLGLALLGLAGLRRKQSA